MKEQRALAAYWAAQTAALKYMQLICRSRGAAGGSGMRRPVRPCVQKKESAGLSAYELTRERNIARSERLKPEPQTRWSQPSNLLVPACLPIGLNPRPIGFDCRTETSC